MFARFDFSNFFPEHGIHDVNNETFKNVFNTKTYGAETTVNWTVTDPWRLSASYAYFDVDSTNYEVATEPQSDPHNQFNIRSFLNLPYNVELDAALFYVDSFTSLGRDISDYVRFDVRLGWRATNNLDVSLVGTNLFDDKHIKYKDGSLESVEIERAIYAKLTWKF